MATIQLLLVDDEERFLHTTKILLDKRGVVTFIATNGADALSAREALQMATVGGAAVLGRDDVGVLAPGKAADFIGIDVCVSILDVLKDGLGDDKYRACPLMRRMVAAGHFGRKTGRGFYEYT